MSEIQITSAAQTISFLPTSTKEGSVLAVELHSHSVRSHDGHDPVDELLEQAQALGLDAIAVTDHDAVDASLKARERAPAYDLIGIPGIEISTADGHVLGLGIETVIPRDFPFDETVERIHDAGGTAIVPHPFQELRKGVLRNISPDELVVADGIEVYNSRLITGRSNRQAKTLARELDMPMTAGSDAHIAKMVGKGSTLVDAAEQSADGILDAIKNGETAIDGNRTPYRVTVRQGVDTAIRRAQRQLF